MASQYSMSLALLIALQCLTGFCSAGGSLGVIITVENDLTNDSREFTYCTLTYMSPRGKPTMFDFIKYTAEINPDFTYESVSFSGLGEYITSLNGLKENTTEQWAWSFGRRYEDGQPDCLFPVGVSSYYPENMEHIVFQFITYSQFADFPTCPISNATITLNFDSNKDNACYKANVRGSLIRYLRKLWSSIWSYFLQLRG